MFLRRGDGTFGERTPICFKEPKPFLARGHSRRHLVDWDRDGHTDLVVGCVGSWTLDVCLGPLADKKDYRSTKPVNLPPIAEAGVPGFDYAIWYGVWTPVGTPAEVVDKLSKDIARALGAPDFHEWLAKHGADAMSMSQPEFARFVLSESENAARLIEAAGIKPR